MSRFLMTPELFSFVSSDSTQALRFLCLPARADYVLYGFLLYCVHSTVMCNLTHTLTLREAGTCATRS